jgi:hypothetical protein
VEHSTKSFKEEGEKDKERKDAKNGEEVTGEGP